MCYMVFSKSILGLMFAACAMLSFFSLDVMNSYSTVRSLRGPHAATRRHLVLLEALRSPVDVMQDSMPTMINDINSKIMLLKTCAAMSMTQSPNDNGPCHRIAKSHFRSYAYETNESSTLVEPSGRRPTFSFKESIVYFA